MHMGRVFLRSW